MLSTVNVARKDTLNSRGHDRSDFATARSFKHFERAMRAFLPALLISAFSRQPATGPPAFWCPPPRRHLISRTRKRSSTT